MTARNVALALVYGGLLALAALGCGQPQTHEDPDFVGTDVEGPAIPVVRQPFYGKTIAVVPFVNKTLSQYPQLGNVAPDILVGYALDAGFRPVESKGGQLDEVIGELEYGQTDYVDPKTAAKIGQQLGAQYCLVGAVTDYRETKAEASKGFDVFGLVGAGKGKEVMLYDVQVSGRIVDVGTREVLTVDTGTAVKQQYEVGGSSVHVLGVQSHESESIETQRESMGKILKIAFARSMKKMVEKLNRVPPPPPPGPGGPPPPPPPGGYPPPPPG